MEVLCRRLLNRTLWLKNVIFIIMSYEVTLLFFGILLIIVGLVGKVKAKEVEIGAKNKVVRIVMGVIGVSLTILSFSPDIVREFLSSEAKTNEPEEVRSVKPDGEASISTDYSGEYRIQLKANGTYLHEDGLGDKKLSVRSQETDDFTRFIFESQEDGSYRIKVKADNLYLHEDGMADKLISTRAQETDDFTKFFVEKQRDGTVKIRVKATNRYWGVAVSTDKLVSTRNQNDNEFSRFNLEKQ